MNKLFVYSPYLLYFATTYMKKYLFFLICIFCLSNGLIAQNASSTCKKASIILKQFEKYHFKPITINEKISSEIFDDFMKRVDYRGLYLTNTDIKTLAPFRNQLGTQISNNSCAFLEAFLKLYKQNSFLQIH